MPPDGYPAFQYLQSVRVSNQGFEGGYTSTRCIGISEYPSSIRNLPADANLRETAR